MADSPPNKSWDTPPINGRNLQFLGVFFTILDKVVQSIALSTDYAWAGSIC